MSLKRLYHLGVKAVANICCIPPGSSCFSFYSLASPGQANFFFHPRSRRVALGETLVLDCVGRFTTSTTTRAIVYRDHTTAQSFNYPDDPGFPEFRFDGVGWENNGALFACTVYYEHAIHDIIGTGNFVLGNFTVSVYG